MTELCVYKILTNYLVKLVRNRTFLFVQYSVTWAFGLIFDVQYSVLWALTAKQVIYIFKFFKFFIYFKHIRHILKIKHKKLYLS